ncbi:MAG: hypothetical protein DME97_09860 [Verrucomicrobia bacterium]|nr:MAG: hypothetical protein DME97_09860 [Verrucomicrobiota bacterium]
MSDELENIILADAASSVAEEPPRRRGIFRRRSKMPEQPLTHCENCGAPLTGEFCAQCGQHAIDYRRSILRVLWDAADSFLNWDTKFLKTLGLLLIRPWELTNDFNAGRRARYVHPLRLYLIASIIFFLLARAINFDSPPPVPLTVQDRTELATNLAKLTGPESPLTAEQRQQVETARTKLLQGEGTLSEQERAELKAAFRVFLKSSFRKNLTVEERAEMATAIARISKAPAPPRNVPDASIKVTDPSIATESGDQPSVPAVSATPKPKENETMHFSTRADGKKTPFGIWIEKQIKEKIGEDGSKARLFADTLRSNIPAMMLCCIPLFAFVLKILYLRKRRFYVEHLVYALHVHTFLYVAVIITSLAVMGANRTVPALAGWITGLMTLAILVQIFLSIRRVYGQGWFLTLVKFVFGGIVYFVILIVAVGATALVTLLLPS